MSTRHTAAAGPNLHCAPRAQERCWRRQNGAGVGVGVAGKLWETVVQGSQAEAEE